MEENQNKPLFGLTIDPAAKSYLHDAARWAKFLAIVGFVMCALILVFGFFAGSFYNEVYTSNRYEGFNPDVKVDRKAVAIGAGIWYSIIALVSFFPCLFLFQFASKMKAALLSDDQPALTSSFQNLKKTFRYVTILTIIGLVFVLLVFLVAIGTRTGMQR